jgi:hypothetical protein
VFERAFMDEEIDAFDFTLAERLGMTVAEMNERMTNIEYIAWRARENWRNAMAELERKAAAHP